MESARFIQEGLQPDGLLVIIGMEYATPQGDFLIFGPFNRLVPGLQAREMLPIVNAQGGVAIAAHPFRSWRPLEVSALNWGAHAIERYNGRNNFDENEQAEDLIEEWGLTATGGSDAHSREELGRVPTRFFDPINNSADLIQAIRLGKCEPHMPSIRRTIPECCTLPSY